MSALEGLPQPALERVLSYLGFNDLSNLGSTCTNLHQALKELTTGVLSVTRPDEMCVQSNRLILGLNLVLDTNEEMLKEMLRSFPKLETLVRSNKYKAGRLKFSVTPTEVKRLAHNDEEGCFKGKVAKNMLSPWGHHLLGHHYLDMLLALHTKLSLPLSHMDLQVNKRCWKLPDSMTHYEPRLICCVRAANSSSADLTRLSTWLQAFTSTWGWLVSASRRGRPAVKIALNCWQKSEEWRIWPNWNLQTSFLNMKARCPNYWTLQKNWTTSTWLSFEEELWRLHEECITTLPCIVYVLICDIQCNLTASILLVLCFLCTCHG